MTRGERILFGLLLAGLLFSLALQVAVGLCWIGCC